MTISVREADLGSERSLLVGFTREFLDASADVARFHWLYEQNPCGVARAWLAFDEARPVGIAAAFPRLLSVSGQKQYGWVLGDFAIASTYRSMGPALKMQRMCLESLGASSSPLWYDFPGGSMVSIYRRLAIEPQTTFFRWVKPIRTASKLGSLLRSNAVGKAASVLVDKALEVKDQIASGSKGRSFDVSPLQSDFNQEFDSLFAACSTSAVRIWRSKEYLTWRFLRHPSRRYEVLVARSGGTLLGYCIFYESGSDTLIDELFGDASRPGLLTSLLYAVAEIARRRGRVSIMMGAMENDPLAAALTRSGFSKREAAPVVFAGGRSSGQWLLTNGDRES